MYDIGGCYATNTYCVERHCVIEKSATLVLKEDRKSIEIVEMIASQECSYYTVHYVTTGQNGLGLVCGLILSVMSQSVFYFVVKYCVTKEEFPSYVRDKERAMGWSPPFQI